MSCISSQSHRFLFYSCTSDFPVALKLTVTLHFNATLELFRSLLEARHPYFDPESSRGVIVRNTVHCIYLQHTLRRNFWWWDWCTVVDGGGTRAMWGGRTNGVRGYGDKEGKSPDETRIEPKSYEHIDRMQTVYVFTNRCSARRKFEKPNGLLRIHRLQPDPK